MTPSYPALTLFLINPRMTPEFAWPRFGLVALILTLSGCANTAKEAILPQTGPTMKAVYDQHFQGGGSQEGATHGERGASPVGRARRYGEGLSDLARYTLDSANETQRVFQRLPNPDLVMYVFPHLAGPEGMPIPGYTTTFPFYDQVHYALPGEVED